MSKEKSRLAVEIAENIITNRRIYEEVRAELKEREGKANISTEEYYLAVLLIALKGI